MLTIFILEEWVNSGQTIDENTSIHIIGHFRLDIARKYFWTSFLNIIVAIGPRPTQKVGGVWGLSGEHCKNPWKYQA